MKKIFYNKFMFMAIAVGAVMSGCNHNDDDVVPNSGNVNTKSTDTTLVVQMNDTLQPPAGDKTSKTFYLTNDHKAHSASDIDANKSLADHIAFAYSYNGGASITNLDNYPDSTGWSNLNNWTTFGTTALDAAAFDAVTTNEQLINAYTAATVSSTSPGAIHALAVGQVFAFQTFSGKNGLIRVVNINPGNDPSLNYIVIDLKMQR
jgi:hypothetical protein